MAGEAEEHRPLPSAPSPANLARLCDAIAPGATVRNVRRLRGGLSAAMHAVDLLMPSGERQRLVVRRFNARDVARFPGLPRRSWLTLAALERLGIAAPRPVWFDEDGSVFGTPSIVMTRLPGRGELCPRDLEDWLRQLGTALAAIHRAPVAGAELHFLPGPGTALDVSLCRWDQSRTRLEEHPDARALFAMLAKWRPRLLVLAPVLTHGDYWSGNTLWLRGRLTAVVDWDEAAVDHAGFDVGYCRSDLAMSIGRHAPAIFLRAYEAAMGAQVSHLALWDLAGAARALPDPAVWLPGCRDLGLRDLTAVEMRSRLREFIAAAIERATAAQV